MADAKADYLKSFELYTPPPSGEKFFGMILCASLAVFLCSGYGLSRIKVAAKAMIRGAQKVDVSFSLPVEKKRVPRKPVDLTQKTELAKNENVIVKAAESGEAARQVYGVRQVFAYGIGSGEGGSNAIVSKIGNTLEKDPDTLTATEKDLKGALVSVTTITSMPAIRYSFKPEYTEEMKANNVEGTISARLLIDTDGKVKDVIVLNDLGFGSREAALEGFKKLTFTPAMQGSTPVAVWVIMKFKFVLEES